MRPRERTPQEELFPFVEMEKLIPENHILRLIDRYVDFSFIHELVEHTYSEDTGRPAVDPELMIRILTIGYLNSLSERKLFDELRMHAAFRWFCNLGFHEPIPDRSTLNKLRNHRWTKDGIFEEIMHRIVRQCVAAGLVKGDHVTVDGTQIEANASIKSLEPIVVEVEVDTYLETLKLKRSKKNRRPCSHHPQDRDFHGETFSNETHRSTTDPDARLHKKSSGQEAKLAYVGNMLIDTKSRVILATAVTQPGVSTEADAALAMIDSLDETDVPEPITTISGDAGYGSTTFITKTLDRGITPHVPLLAQPDHEPIPTWKTATHIPEQFQKRLKKIKETAARNHVRDLSSTPAYRQSQRTRKRIEHIFAEAKNWHGLARARSRGCQAVSQQVSLTGFVLNCKRLARFMHCHARKVAAVAISRLECVSITSNLLNNTATMIQLVHCVRKYWIRLNTIIENGLFYSSSLSPGF